MKILLINPSRIYYPGSKDIRLGLPLGLLYLAAVLEKNGYQPKIFDCLLQPESTIINLNDKIIHGLPDDLIVKVIKQENPEIIGITNPFTAQLESAINLANLIKQVNPKIITVIGGPHISTQGLELLKENKNIDIGVKGEGEYTFLKLIQNLEEKKPINSLLNVIYRDSHDQVKENEFSGFINNLDELPYPAYHLIDLERYFSFLEQGLKTRPGGYLRSVSMITSRGCPYNCIFCSIHLHMGKRFRAHSPDYIANHLKYLVEKYQVKHVSFEDDNFSLDLNRCKKILNDLLQQKIKITWDTPNGVRADRIDEELVILMKKSGCQELIFGVESGSQRVLNEIIEKNLSLERVLKAVQLCYKYKIKIKAFYVIGFPGETKDDLEMTKDFALNLYKKYNVDFGPLIATPLINTRLYQVCKDNGYLIKEPDPKTLSIATQASGQGLIKTPEFDPAYLKNLAALMMKLKAKINFRKKMFNPKAYWVYLKRRILKANKKFL